MRRKLHHANASNKLLVEPNDGDPMAACLMATHPSATSLASLERGATAVAGGIAANVVRRASVMLMSMAPSQVTSSLNELQGQLTQEQEVVRSKFERFKERPAIATTLYRWRQLCAFYCVPAVRFAVHAIVHAIATVLHVVVVWRFKTHLELDESEPVLPQLGDDHLEVVWMVFHVSRAHLVTL